jgi:hypothetical protein
LNARFPNASNIAIFSGPLHSFIDKHLFYLLAF